MYLLENFAKARRKLRTLRGLDRLKRMLDGNAVKSQTTNTLKCMQMLARVQALIHSRRVRMIEENQALQRHLQRKHGKELENVKVCAFSKGLKNCYLNLILKILGIFYHEF